MSLWRNLFRARRAAAQSDQGVALIAVIGTGMVMTMAATVSLGYSVNSLRVSDIEQDRVAALTAAQAGVEDYLSYLNGTTNYWTKPTANLINPSHPDYNPAMAGWVTVPGPASRAQFRYQVLTSTASTQTDGLVRLRSSGRVDSRVRTIEATLRKAAFQDYVYFSDKEVGDPSEPGYYPTLNNGNPTYWATRSPQAICNVYNWQSGFNSRNSNCAHIYWSTGDTLVGDAHTNDSPYMANSPVFNGRFTTGCPAQDAIDPCYNRQLWIPLSGNTPTPNLQQPMSSVGIIRMPTTNTQLLRDADPAQGGNGCVYYGPTRIVLRSNGTMFVNSPNTPTSGALSNVCGTGDNRPLPPNGVIYIRNIPAGSMFTTAQSSRCSRPWVTTPSSVPRQSNSGGRDYPLSNDTTAYQCTNGDAFIEGTLSGQLTVGTENELILTGSVRYQGGYTGTDVLGLVAQNFVRIYRPVNSSNSLLVSNPAMRNLTIDAAVLTVSRSFAVQNFRATPATGTLAIRGSLIQNFRGPVGTFSGQSIVSGYAKDYQYDRRLRYLSPPKFLDPIEASWRPAETREVNAAF